MRQQHRVRIGANAEKRGVTKTDQAGVADQQHQPDTGDGENEHAAHFTDVELVQNERNGHDDDHQQAVPEHVAGMAPCSQVLLIAGSEQVAHQTLLPIRSAKRPCGRMNNMPKSTMLEVTSWNPAGK